MVVTCAFVDIRTSENMARSRRHHTLQISGPLRFKHHQNSTQGPQERERRKERILWREREKKREILGPPPFGAPPFGVPLFLGLGPPPFWAPPFEAPLFLGLRPPPFWAPPFGAPLFLGLGPPPFGPPTLLGSTLLGSTLRGPHTLSSQNSTSKNWPKSKLAEVESAELEKKSWPKSKLAEVDHPRWMQSPTVGNLEALKRVAEASLDMWAVDPGVCATNWGTVSFCAVH